MNLLIAETMDKLVRANLLISTGCTEPIAIAYAAATARKTLGKEPVKISLSLSANIAKNAMDAGVPGSKYVGAAFAAALGALYADSEKGFELLEGMNLEQQEAAYAFAKNNVQIEIAQTDQPLYIEVKLQGTTPVEYISVGGVRWPNTARVVVAGTHTNVCVNEFNGKSVIENVAEIDSEKATVTATEIVPYTMCDVYDYVSQLKDLTPFKMAVVKNTELSVEGKCKPWGLDVGKMHPFGEETISSRIVATTTSAVDARMAGAEKPAVACTGSGNQGITITLPIAQLAKEKGLSDEETYKAVAVGILSAIYIKQHLNVLSHLCGAVIAGAAAAAGMTYILGGTYQQAEAAIANVLASVVGMFCDGAKNTCALKVAGCVSMAIYAANLAMTDSGCVNERVGIVSENIGGTIENIAKIESRSSEVMSKTILEIITS